MGKCFQKLLWQRMTIPTAFLRNECLFFRSFLIRVKQQNEGGSQEANEHSRKRQTTQKESARENNRVMGLSVILGTPLISHSG